MGDKNYRIKNLYLDMSNPKSVAASKLLDKAGRKQALLVSIMAYEFMESFGITEDISEKDLKKIISMYDILKSMKGKTQYPILVQNDYMQSTEKNALRKDSFEKIIETEEKKEIKAEKNDDKEREELEAALSQFDF